MKKLILISLLFLLAFSFVGASDLGAVKVNNCINLYQHCASCSYVNLTAIKYPNQTIVTYNSAMNKSGSDYIYNFCNTSDIGNYFYTVCGDTSSGNECRSFNFEVTNTGTAQNAQQMSLASYVLSFFLILIVSLYFSTRGIDFDKWHEKIINRYKEKNWIKLSLSIIVYNLMKNLYMVYYLLGLPIIVILTMMTYNYNLVQLMLIMKIVLILYLVGIVIMGLVFLSFIQEFIVNLLDIIKNMNWGTE